MNQITYIFTSHIKHVGMLDTIYSFEHFDFLHQDEDEEEQKERRCNTNIRFEAPDLKAEKSGS